MKNIFLLVLIIACTGALPAYAYQDIACTGKIHNESVQVFYNESRKTITLDGHDFEVSVQNKNGIASRTYHNNKGQSFYAVLGSYQFDNQTQYAFALMNGAPDRLNEIIFSVDLQCQKLKKYF
jgi:hypothetical protein